MSIRIIQAGLATSVQDLGRPGYYHLGIPLSGALDQYAHRTANLLVGNLESAATIECAFMAATIECQTDTAFAVSGAQCEILCNGAPIAANTCHPLRAGDILSFGFMKSGARIYLAFGGGIEVPIVLGSRSTYGLGAFGGVEGRKLKAGDVLPLGPAGRAVSGRTVPDSLLFIATKEQVIRVLPGLYAHRLSEASRESFYRDVWRVAPEADRIGYRYKGGSALSFQARTAPFGAGSDPSNIVDAGYPYGSIQVPSGTEPIILHRDAVSGGGYAMIATVISADMDLIAQMQPGYRAQFVAVDMATALAARANRQQQLGALRQHLRN